ncbi:hypothetical protein TNCT_715361 [Trichonephila clavata]|uniref:Uncharacterized protein n=1 Tax=Trichonephila clavata TaxID=2740835 RepID=A0A8X6KB27_TRICU|nr:hypothetical protein TNCT_715361 [Trichonephila clavata]
MSSFVVFLRLFNYFFSSKNTKRINGEYEHSKRKKKGRKNPIRKCCACDSGRVSFSSLTSDFASRVEWPRAFSSKKRGQRLCCGSAGLFSSLLVASHWPEEFLLSTRPCISIALTIGFLPAGKPAK